MTEMRIVEFVCARGHHTAVDCDLTNRFKVEQCATCHEVVNVWEHARFRAVQPDAVARHSTAGVMPNTLGAGDLVEQKRQRVKDLYGEDYYQ